MVYAQDTLKEREGAGSMNKFEDSSQDKKGPQGARQDPGPIKKYTDVQISKEDGLI